MNPLVTMMRRHGRDVQRLQGQQAAEFLRLLEATRDELQARLLMAGITDPDEPIRAWRVRAVIAETEAAIRGLRGRAAGVMTGVIDRTAEMAADHLEAELTAIGVDWAAAGPLEFAPDAIATLADPRRMLLANHFEVSVERWGLDMLNDIRRRIFTGMSVGTPYREIVRSITGQSGPLGRVARYEAERIVRTETLQSFAAAKQGHAERLAEALEGPPARPAPFPPTVRPAPGQRPGIAPERPARKDGQPAPQVLKMWWHTGSYPCPVCIPLHGTTRPTDGTWEIVTGKRKVQRRKVAHPPAHPNCVCTFVITSPTAQKRLDRLGYLDRAAALDAKWHEQLKQRKAA